MMQFLPQMTSKSTAGVYEPRSFSHPATTSSPARTPSRPSETFQMLQFMPAMQPSRSFTISDETPHCPQFTPPVALTEEDETPRCSQFTPPVAQSLPIGASRALQTQHSETSQAQLSPEMQPQASSTEAS